MDRLFKAQEKTHVTWQRGHRAPTVGRTATAVSANATAASTVTAAAAATGSADRRHFQRRRSVAKLVVENRRFGDEGGMAGKTVGNQKGRCDPGRQLLRGGEQRELCQGQLR